MEGIPEDARFDNFEWSKLDEYASYLHEQDAVRQKLGVHDMQKKLRADLDKQVRHGVCADVFGEFVVYSRL